MSCVEVDGARWRWVHGLVIPIQIILHLQKHIISVTFYIFQATVLCMMYAIIMTIITIDTFLEFQLTITYPLFCTVKKAKNIVLFFLIISILTFSWTLTLYLIIPLNYANFSWKYFYLGGNSVVIAAFIYDFIFKKLKRNRKDIRRSRKQVNVCVQEKRVFKIFIPSLIIVTFIIFIAIPNLMEAISYTEYIPEFIYYIRIAQLVGFWTILFIF